MQPLSRLLGKPNLTVYEWYHGKVKPVINNLLRICYCLDLRLIQLLTGEGIYEKGSFNIKQFILIEPTKQRRKPTSFNHIKAKNQLSKYLTIQPPKPLIKVSVETGYDKGTLLKWLPELCNEISQRYRDFLQKSYKSYRDQREEEVKQACIELFKQNIYLSARAVAKFLGKPSYLGRRDVAGIIKIMRTQLGQAKK